MYCSRISYHSLVNDVSHLAFLMHMPLHETTLHHLRMQMIQDPLDPSDPAIHLPIIDLIQAIVRHEVQQFWVEIIEALIGS